MGVAPLLVIKGRSSMAQGRTLLSYWDGAFPEPMSSNMLSSLHTPDYAHPFLRRPYISMASQNIHQLLCLHSGLRGPCRTANWVDLRTGIAGTLLHNHHHNVQSMQPLPCSRWCHKHAA